MRSNKELRAEAVELGEKLGVAVDVEGKNNAALTALVAGLTESLEAGDVPAADVPPEDADDEPTEDVSATAEKPQDKPAEKPVERRRGKSHVVVSGRSVTSLRGIIDAGSEVTARDFSGGQAALDSLVSRGIVVAKG